MEQRDLILELKTVADHSYAVIEAEERGLADPGHRLHRRRHWFRRLRPTGNRTADGEGAVRGSSPASVGPASEGTRAKLM
jgi:hypothetical protein